MQKRKIVPIIDFAHGSNVSGKRSPDGRHLEWRWSRKVGRDFATLAKSYGFQPQFSNPLDTEGGLMNRVKFADNLKVNDGQIKILISLHNNAAGDGTKWMSARGFEIWTSKGFDSSDVMAEYAFESFKEWFPNIKMRYALDKDFQRDKEGELAVLKTKNAFAILFEYCFQDNKEDVELLLNETENKKVADALMDVLLKMEEYLQKNDLK